MKTSRKPERPPTGKVAVITGGGRGLGSALALKCGQLGYKVAIVGRSSDALQKRRDDLQQQGIDCIFRVCDGGNWDAVSKCVDSIAEEAGPISVLINNAGGYLGEKLETLPVEKFRAMLDGTLLSAWHFSRAAIPSMRRIGGGVILNIGSSSGLPTSRDPVAATVPKAAIAAFSSALAREVRTDGIRVAVLHPARMNKKISDDEAEKRDASGSFNFISYRQVAEIAGFMITQPLNVFIREIVVTPSGVDL